MNRSQKIEKVIINEEGNIHGIRIDGKDALGLDINPKIYCLFTMEVLSDIDLDCEHEWKANIGDTYSEWSCKKCFGRVGAEVWQ